MDIIQYITEQLYSKQEVVLSGFGKFVGERKPAYVDTENQKIYPPSKTVSFIRDTKSFALDLAIYVSRKEFVTEDDAAKAINQFVKAANEKLAKGQPVVFEGIGVITSAADGKTSFKQSQKANLLPETFGMEPIELKADTTVVAAAADEKKDSNWAWWLVGAVALLLISGLVYWKYFYTNPKQAYTKTPVVKVDSVATIAENKKADFIDTANVGADTVVDDGAAEKLNGNDHVKDSFNTRLLNRSVIYLIVGSFQDKNKAEEYLGQLKGQGYDSEIIAGDNGYLRVTIGKFPNSEEAMVVYEKYIAQYPKNDIWAL